MRKLKIALLFIMLPVLLSSCTIYRLTQNVFESILEEQNDYDPDIPIEELRPDYDLNACRDLRGDVSVVLFYMNDSESEWTDSDVNYFTNNEVIPALEFLEEEARFHGIDLNLDIKETHCSIYYDYDVIVSVKEKNLATINVLWEAAKSLGFSSDTELIEAYKSKYGTEVICLTLFNKNGTSYGLNPPRGDDTKVEEHCIIFAYDLDPKLGDLVGSQSTTIAHSILYLYGAENFYTTESRKYLAQIYYPDDIMLAVDYVLITNNIGDATAFYIGWTDTPPAVLYNKNW